MCRRTAWRPGCRSRGEILCRGNASGTVFIVLVVFFLGLGSVNEYSSSVVKVVVVIQIRKEEGERERGEER